MSLSPLVSFKSRFVTYLLNFPRRSHSDFLSTKITLPQNRWHKHNGWWAGKDFRHIRLLLQ